MNKKLIRLTESDLHRIVKESVNRVINEGLLTEGEKWIGEFNHSTFGKLRQYVNELSGNASFSLNGTDFTIVQTQRGFTVTSGINGFKYDSLNIDSALKAAWQFSNGVK